MKHMEDKTRFERGLEKLAEVDGAVGDQVIQSLKEIAPDLGRFIIEFAFGDIYTRSALDLKQRECITLASLATQGGTENQLRVHINGALNVGLTLEEIAETFIQCVPYVGFPRVLNAVAVAKEVFKKRELI
jgi:4-carboxymuconolactone decarboxylase